MTDPVVLAMPPADVAGAAAPRPAPTARFDPQDTKMFANLMQGVSMPQGASAGAPSTLRDAAMALAAQFGGNVRSLEDMRHSMLESIDLSDPIRTMFAITDHSMEAQTMFAKLHISTSLASAATNLFGTLLKNQQ